MFGDMYSFGIRKFSRWEGVIGSESFIRGVGSVLGFFF